MSAPLKSERKPDKPYPGFPLYSHRNGQWCKRIRKTIHYFGTWDDPQAAVDLYEFQREALYAGRTPPVPGSSALTLVTLCNAFTDAKQSLHFSGELTRRTWDDYNASCQLLVKSLGGDRLIEGLIPADFDRHREMLAKKWGPVRLGNEIVRVRSIFHYAYNAGLIDKPIRFGPHFKRPSAKAMRLAKADAGLRLFTRAELKAVLDVADEPMKTMILLGINCGLGNSDIGKMERRHVDLVGRWLNFPRPKTGIPRRARLWPETITGLRKAFKVQRVPRNSEDDNRVFLTKYGRPWHKGTRDNPITKEMSKLLKEAKLERAGLNFYALRHTFQTIGEECGDLAAVRFVMGHAPHVRDMSAVYRESISDLRLLSLSNHVHLWLFKRPKGKRKAS